MKRTKESIKNEMETAKQLGINYSLHRKFPAKRFCLYGKADYVPPGRAWYLKQNERTVRETGRIVRFSNLCEVMSFMRADLRIAARSV